MSDGRDPGASGIAPLVADGALLGELIACNARARIEMTSGTSAADATTDAEAGRRGAEAAWAALVRQTHGTPLAYLHVHQFYNRVLASLRRPPSDAESLTESPPMLYGGEVDRAFADPGVLVAPYELTRGFFARLRARHRPWRDEGDEKFHRYLARCAKWLAVEHKREIGLLPRRSPARRIGTSRSADPRRVKAVLLDALLAPEVLALLTQAKWLPPATQTVLLQQQQLAASSDADSSRRALPVSPKVLRSALAEALDRLSADRGFVPPLEPAVEVLIDRLLRSRSAWDRSWAAWCAALDPIVLRDLVRWHQTIDARGGRTGLDSADALSEAYVETLTAPGGAGAAYIVCDFVLPAVIERYATVLLEARTAVATLGDALACGIIEDQHAGMSTAQSAAKRGITPTLLYKRLERIRRQVAAHLARTPAGQRDA